MNIRRGLFRIWILGSAAWASIVAYDYWGRIEDPYIESQEYIYEAATHTIERLSDERSTELSFSLLKDYDELALKNRVTLFVPQSVGVEAAKPRVQAFNKTVPPARDEEVTAARWKLAFEGLKFALVPVITLLIAGLALLWVAAGFKSRTT